MAIPLIHVSVPLPFFFFHCKRFFPFLLSSSSLSPSFSFFPPFLPRSLSLFPRSFRSPFSLLLVPLHICYSILLSLSPLFICPFLSPFFLPSPSLTPSLPLSHRLLLFPCSSPILYAFSLLVSFFLSLSFPPSPSPSSFFSTFFPSPFLCSPPPALSLFFLTLPFIQVLRLTSFPKICFRLFNISVYREVVLEEMPVCYTYLVL